MNKDKDERCLGRSTPSICPSVSSSYLISPLLYPSHSCITTPATQAFSRNNRHHGKHLSRTCALPMERPHEREEARDRILRARSTPKIIPRPSRHPHEFHDMRSIRIRQSRARHRPNRQRQSRCHTSVQSTCISCGRRERQT